MASIVAFLHTVRPDDAADLTDANAAHLDTLVDFSVFISVAGAAADAGARPIGTTPPAAAAAAAATSVAAVTYSATFTKTDLQALQRLEPHAPLPTELLHAPVWSLHSAAASNTFDADEKQALQAQEKRFHQELKTLGIADVVWTQYQAWRDGRFDLAWMAHCLNMPESVASDPDTAWAYLRAAPSDQTRLYQARVLVLGDGGVGKTTLIKRLLDPSQALPHAEPATPRIEVSQQTLTLPVQIPAGETTQAQPVTVHYWDFGGQAWMHSTHQFFLREQALYVVLVNLRENTHKERLLYWLEHVKLFGKGSPTVVVYSKLDELPNGQPVHPDFDPAQLQRDYGFIQGFFHLSSDLSQPQYRQRFENFQTVLHGLIASPQVLGGGMLKQWNDLNLALQAQYRHQAVISRFEAEQIAKNMGLPEGEVGTALKALDLLGLALQFDDLKINDHLVVLDPNWIILSLYHVLQYGNTRHFHGKLNIEKIRLAFMDEAGRALSQRLNLPFDTQGDAHSRFLLDLLLHFELAFKVPSGHDLGGSAILSPMLAGHAVPEHPFRSGQYQPDALHFEVRFARLLPEAVLHQFAARSAQEVWGDGRIWRTGVWLQAPASQAVVSLDSAERTLTLRVNGSGAGVYMARLRLRLFELLFGPKSPYQEAEVECRAFMNGQPFDWQEVLEACAENPFELLRGKGNFKVSARDMVLQGVPEHVQRSPQTMDFLQGNLGQEMALLLEHMLRTERAEGMAQAYREVAMAKNTISLTQQTTSTTHNHNQSQAAAQAHAEAQAQAQALVQQQIALCDNATLHLMDLKAEVSRALATSDAPAAACDKALRQLGVEVENLLGQVAQHRINAQDSSMAAPQKKQFLDRLQKGWGALTQCLDQINTLTDVGEKAFNLLQHPGVRDVWEPLVKVIDQFKSLGN